MDSHTDVFPYPAEVIEEEKIPFRMLVYLQQQGDAPELLRASSGELKPRPPVLRASRSVPIAAGKNRLVESFTLFCLDRVVNM